MRFSLYLDDYETEKIFSYLRWVFLIAAIFLFYLPALSDTLQWNEKSFPILLSFGLIYMTAAQIALHKMNTNQKAFSIITKAGIAFDYIAFFWLIILSGGAFSPLLPISFLIVMHATIYWRTKGAILSSISLTAGYTAVMLSGSPATDYSILVFLLNIMFIWIIGLFGSLIILRERQHRRQKEIYHELLVRDYLTDLYNHRYFQEQMKKLSQTERPFFIIMGDIDHFKPINDEYGHLTGDEVLKELGGIFTEAANKYGGQAFRYGGEEFAFLMPDWDESKVEPFLNSIYKSLNEKQFTAANIPITMSFGVSHHAAGRKINESLEVADQLLYQAKNSGKNQVHFECGKCMKNHTFIRAAASGN
ncbi:diguanylate cyclase [Bacillus sp. ISL-47]|uniref:GGDEF domain-containing protein n=1 Tax=Bacillus sp. ISL-47 TaxID=2819130 RepID=UPI001BE5746D|nr:GGDEF domain-containing protein [Bacillus sp. ISL-47]MBT2690789.1 diguanylate cyclase [Bacillus sp. ISL-47]MBT2710196.1 diguanylate cyclase [Pseudomonas sp. ISL-84]